MYPSETGAQARIGSRHVAGILGITAPLLYAATVIVGGLITPGYSHLSNAISDLTIATASQRLPLSVAFVVYDLLIVAFAVMLPRALPEAGRREIVAAAAILATVGAAGVGMSSVFPGPASSSREITLIGWIHIVLAAIASLGSMATIVAVTRALRPARRWDSFRRASYIFLGLIVLSGIAAAVSVALHTPLIGLAERITIGTFVLWIFALGARILSTETAPDPSG